MGHPFFLFFFFLFPYIIYKDQGVIGYKYFDILTYDQFQMFMNKKDSNTSSNGQYIHQSLLEMYHINIVKSQFRKNPCR